MGLELNWITKEPSLTLQSFSFQIMLELVLPYAWQHGWLGRVVIVAEEGSSIARGGTGMATVFCYGLSGGLLSRRDHPQRIWTNIFTLGVTCLETLACYCTRVLSMTCPQGIMHVHPRNPLYTMRKFSQLGYVNNSTHGSVSTTHSKYIALKYNIY